VKDFCAQIGIAVARSEISCQKNSSVPAENNYSHFITSHKCTSYHLCSVSCKYDMECLSI